MEMFKQMVPSEERILTEKIEAKGGSHVVLENDMLLRELFDDNEKKVSARSGKENPGKALPTSTRSQGQSTYGLSDLKDELHEGWETAVRKNIQSFEGKFRVEQRRLREQLERFIQDENDRLLTTITSGPHDLIKHPVRYAKHTTLWLGVLTLWNL